MRLAELLEQEGQPCSYCIAVFLITSTGERLLAEDAESYRRHLLSVHGLESYSIQP